MHSGCVARLAASTGTVLILVLAAAPATQPAPRAAFSPHAEGDWSRLCASRGPGAPRPRVLLQTGVDVAAAARRAPRGTTFCIRAGLHRMRQAIVPKTRDRFVGEPGAVLSGAREIGARFTRAGRFWVAAGQTQQNPRVHGRCATGTACRYANDVFVDNRPLRRVLSEAQLASGRFYFDYARDRIWIADSPQGHHVEAAVARWAFNGSEVAAEHVTIEGLTVEKFANEAQTGAISGRPSWTVQDCDVRLNHGGGIQDAGRMIHNHVHHNGQIGIGADWSIDGLVARNEIDHNNYAGFDIGWEAGGAKWLHTSRLMIRDNDVHDNAGAGLWTDTDNVRTTFLRNTITNNAGPGIFHEISYDAVIAHNVVTRNGRKETGWVDGAGILISSSRNVDVHDNLVAANEDGIGLVETARGTGRYGKHLLRNVVVHDNVVKMTSGQTGLVNNTHDRSLYTTGGNRFQANTYVIGCDPLPFAWARPGGSGDYTYVTKEAWVAAGNDTRGRFDVRCHRSG
jgi:hypothetical protein